MRKLYLSSVIGLSTAFVVFFVSESRATAVPIDLLNRLLTVESVVTVIDGQLKISEDVIKVLHRQIDQLKTVSYEPIEYKQDDYAITIGALVGTGDQIQAELANIIAMGKERRRELLLLSERDGELAETEAAYAVAHRAAQEYEKIFGELLDKGYGGIDKLLGSPVFNNWLMLYDEVLPLLASRLGEVRRIRRQLDTRRAQLHKHNRKSLRWLDELNVHLQRIRAAKEAQTALSEDRETTRLLERIDNGRQEVEDLRKNLAKTNEEVRRKAKKVFERQKAAYKRVRWVSGVLSVLKLGLAVAADGSGTEGAAMGSTVDGNISITIENNTTIIEAPSGDMMIPEPPTIIRP